MSNHNPFSQWPTANQHVYPAARPSVFGALPFSGPSSTPAVVAFNFEFNTSILNSIVTDPNGQVYFRISTDDPKLGFTFIHNAHGRPVVVIEWQTHPIVEIRDVLPKQHVSHWMELSPQRNSRHLQIRSLRCVWTPGDGSIILLNPTVNPPERLGRVINGQRRVTLELTSYAIQAGLTEGAIVSAFLLLSGRNID